MIIKYSSNNSGGDWWLNKSDWIKLEKAGWKVKWDASEFLGASARSCSKDFSNIREALIEFEQLTGQEVTDGGCTCCGPPHCFSWDDEKGKHEYATGQGLLSYLFPDKKIPKNLREAIQDKEK